MSYLDNWPPSDFARCLNEQCGVRDNCLRWSTRNTENARVFMTGDGGKDCDYYTRISEDEPLQMRNS